MIHFLLHREINTLHVYPSEEEYSTVKDSGFEDSDYCSPDDQNLTHTDNTTPKTILILMSDTGGGHRASAEAIKQAFESEYGDKYRVCIDGVINHPD